MSAGSGLPSKCASYRDILLGAESGKVVQSIVRPVLNEIVEEYTAETQYGSGLNNGTTETAHLYARACIDLAKMRALSVGLLFIDVKTAFASMIRAITMPFDAGQNPDEVYKGRLLKLGFKDTEADEIISSAETLFKWQQAGGSEHLAKYISKLYSTSWMSTEGCSKIFMARSGTVAGTPLADLIFTCSVACVFKQVRGAFDAAGLTIDIDLDLLANNFDYFWPNEQK